jgi:diguanylate cyclase (GGDEF)-like protein
MATMTPAREIQAAGTDSCDPATVETPGAIQGFGFLVAADTTRDGLPVTRISANAQHWLGVPAPTAIGEPLAAILGQDLANRIACNQPLDRDDHRTLDGMLAGPNGTAISVTVTIHPRDGGLVLEIESAARSRPTELFRDQCRALERFARCEDSHALLQQVIEEIAALTDYDHVMAYRFNEDWNGEVLAEVTDGRPQRFVGQHFPQSDIPAFVRALLQRQRLRIVADTRVEPVVLIPRRVPQGAEPDLSDCVLRAPATVHRAYLRNMGVRSALSLSLVVDGNLWGMILCHADEPSRLSQPVRQLAELLTRQAALYLGSLLREEDDFETRALERRLKRLRRRIAGRGSVADCLQESGDWLLRTFSCEAIIVRLAGRRIAIGRSVTSATEAALARHGAETAIERVADSHRITGRNSPLAHDEWVAGFLYMALSQDGNDYCLWLRAERPHTITWAGNPDKAIDPDTPEHLKARRSFAEWTETIRGACAPWRSPEKRAGRTFLDMLQLRIACDYRSLQEREPTLRRLALNDALTGLPNRSCLLETLDTALHAVDTDPPPTVCLFIDLDHFKPINDGYGHRAGDTILEIIAARLLDAVRDTDTVGRLGGDEFLVISPLSAGTDWQTAGTQLARKLASVIQQPIALNGRQHRLECSIGVAAAGHHGNDPESLLRAADAAMYHAKRCGLSYQLADDLSTHSPYPSMTQEQLVARDEEPPARWPDVGKTDDD